MKKVGDGLKILMGVVFSLILGLWIGLTQGKQEVQGYKSVIPPCPDTSRPMFFDFDSKTWIYVYDQPRANDPKKNEDRDEEIQRMLERKIPGYLEDTYWGEEYDLGDDEGDDR